MPLRGASQLIVKFNSLPKQIQEEIKDLVEDTGIAIVTDARNNLRAVPHGGEGLAKTEYEAANAIFQAIHNTPIENGLGVKVEVNAGEMGAYIEFGTGVHAAALVPTLPKEWQDTAKLFYKNGKGTIRSYPYLYPAWIKNEPLFLAECKDILKKAAR